MERMTILHVFEQAHTDKAHAGKMLGISRATLYRKLKRYNITTRGTEKEEAPETESHAAGH
jgi:transcriptional regulator of acetoin/glycerol metabolism